MLLLHVHRLIGGRGCSVGVSVLILSNPFIEIMDSSETGQTLTGIAVDFSVRFVCVHFFFTGKRGHASSDVDHQSRRHRTH